jgi:hypothetical protein
LKCFSQITDAMVQSDAEGRRVFSYGTPFTEQHSVYVDGEQERDLRTTYERGFVVFILAIVLLAPLASLWVRLVLTVPIWFMFIETTLRSKTAALPPEPDLPRRSQRELALSGAQAMGRPLLWGLLIFFIAAEILATSPAMRYEELSLDTIAIYQARASTHRPVGPTISAGNSSDR